MKRLHTARSLAGTHRSTAAPCSWARSSVSLDAPITHVDGLKLTEDCSQELLVVSELNLFHRPPRQLQGRHAQRQGTRPKGQDKIQGR